MEQQAGFEPAVLGICSPLHWTSLPLLLVKYIMKRIYLDHWYSPIIGDNHEYETIYDYSQIPNDCDVIGLTFYDAYYDTHLPAIELCREKCEKLIVVESEPLSHHDGEFINYSKFLADQNIKVFSDTIFNFSVDNLGTAISWFTTNQNYYAPSSWPHWERWRNDMLFSISEENWKRSAVFDCLLGTKRFHRDIIDDYYNKFFDKTRFIFSYFGKDITQGIWPRSMDLTGIPMTAAHIRYAGLRVPLSAILPFEIYNQSYYSIVAETTCNNDYSHFTEKVAKPMLARRPFVVFSGQHYLRNLRSLGFQTFSDVINESYDSISDDAQRFSAAWTEVETMCRRDPKQVYRVLQDVLDHNQRHFIETDWYRDLRAEILQ